MSEQKTITVKLDPGDHRKVKVLAAELGITIKDLLLRCVDRLKEEHDRIAQEAESMIEPIGSTVADIWEEGDEIYVKDEDAQVGQLRYGWWNGCANCGAYQDQISEIDKEGGPVKACKYALDNLYDGGQEGFLCKECVINKKIREES
ncbi:MAG: hypothetical protein U5L00_11370 [Desulfovermiculus sp.]|nr:hypothetical protein [Desulfovermiculus sp.]